MLSLPAYHRDLFDEDAEPYDLLNSAGSGFNVVDASVAAAVDPASPWILYKGHSPDTWFYAPRWGRLKKRPDGSPDFLLSARYENQSSGGRICKGGTLSFLFELAQELPSQQELDDWQERIKKLTGIVPQGTRFTFQPLMLFKGKLNAYGLDGKTTGDQPIKGVDIGAASDIAFAIEVNGDTADAWAKAIQLDQSATPQIAIVCDFKYRYILPQCQVDVSGFKKKTYDYFSEHFQARASYFGLWGGSVDISNTRVAIAAEGGLTVSVAGTPPAGFSLDKLQDALFDKFLRKEAADWFTPDATPVQGPAPGGFFGGASYAMKHVNIDARDHWSGQWQFADIAEEVHKLSFNFESAFASLDPKKNLVIIESDNVLEMKLTISSCELVDRYATVASYHRGGDDIRVDVPDLASSGGITTGVIQWSGGIESKPTSSQAILTVGFKTPYQPYITKKVEPIGAAGAVYLFHPDTFVARGTVLFVLDYSDKKSLALFQWKFVPGQGSDIKPVSAMVRITPDATGNSLNVPDTSMVFAYNPDDQHQGKLYGMLQGLQGDWKGKKVGPVELPLGQFQVGFTWGGLVDIPEQGQAAIAARRQTRRTAPQE